MKIYLNLIIAWCLGMTIYHFAVHPEETHELIFWSMLTLFNNQNLIKINQND